MSFLFYCGRNLSYKLMDLTHNPLSLLKVKQSKNNIAIDLHFDCSRKQAIQLKIKIYKMEKYPQKQNKYYIIIKKLSQALVFHS